MKHTLAYGLSHVDLTIPPEKRLDIAASNPGVVDHPRDAVYRALEQPLRFEAFRRALTPDDHVVIVVDEQLPHLADLLAGALDYLQASDIPLDAIKILTPPATGYQTWLDNLPDEFQDVHVENHTPGNRQGLSYLATTKSGRRIYLNRSLVDADQLLILAGRRFDRGVVGGGVQAIFPSYADQETRDQLALPLTDEQSKTVAADAEEIAWMLGSPFWVQVIEGSGDTIAAVVAGMVDTMAEGESMVRGRWQSQVHERPDLVIATLTGTPDRHDYPALACALRLASRIVEPGGIIALLCEAAPAESSAITQLRRSDEPDEALRLLHKLAGPDALAARRWARAATQARPYLLSGLDAEFAEDLFVIPLDRASQVQRLIDSCRRCLLLPDADKRHLVIREG